MSNNLQLSAMDNYVLARTIVGLSLDNLPQSALVQLLLSGLNPTAPDDLQILRRLLGQGRVFEIFKVDPTAIHRLWFLSKPT